MNDNTLASSVKKARKKLNVLSLKKVTFSIKFFVLDDNGVMWV